MNRLGNPAVVMPRYACAPSCHASSMCARRARRRRCADRYFVVGEAGGDDDRVDLALDAVDGDDGRGVTRSIALGDELEVGFVEGCVVDVRHQRALAAERVRRRELAPHFGIAARRRSRRRPIASRSALSVAGRRTSCPCSCSTRPRPGTPAAAPGRRRNASIWSAVYGHVELRQHPVGRALEEVDLTGGLDDLRHELHGAGRAADHGDALAGEVVVASSSGPSGTSCRRTCRARRSSGQCEVVEHPDGADDDVGVDLVARLERERPRARSSSSHRAG